MNQRVGLGNLWNHSPNHPNQVTGAPCFCFRTKLPIVGVEINVWTSTAWSASGWLLSLNTLSLNDCCDQKQTVKSITGRFYELKN